MAREKCCWCGDVHPLNPECNQVMGEHIADLEEREAQRDKRIADLEAECAKLRAKDKQVCALIAESRGIEGLHLNGDIAAWEELMHSVSFGSWLDTYADDFPLDNTGE